MREAHRRPHAGQPHRLPRGAMHHGSGLALAESALALLLACAAVAALLAPVGTVGSQAAWRHGAAELALALALPLHWLALAAAARRMGRRARGWVAMAVLLFPVGGAAALLLLLGLRGASQAQVLPAR